MRQPLAVIDGAPGLIAKVKINAAVGFPYPDERLVLDAVLISLDVECTPDVLQGLAR